MLGMIYFALCVSGYNSPQDVVDSFIQIISAIRVIFRHVFSKMVLFMRISNEGSTAG